MQRITWGKKKKKGIAEPFNQQQEKRQDVNYLLEREANLFFDAEGKGIMLLPHYSSVTSSVWTLLSSCFVPRVSLSSGLTFALTSHLCPDE